MKEKVNKIFAIPLLLLGSGAIAGFFIRINNTSDGWSLILGLPFVFLITITTLLFSWYVAFNILFFKKSIIQNNKGGK